MNEQALLEFAVKNWRYVGVVVAAYALTQYVPAVWFRFRETLVGQKMPAAGIGDFVFGGEMRLLMAYVWCIAGVYLMPLADGCEPLGWFSTGMLGVVLGMATTNGRDLAKLAVKVVVRKFYPSASNDELEKKIEALTEEHHETIRDVRPPSTTRSMLAAVENHFDSK